MEVYNQLSSKWW